MRGQLEAYFDAAFTAPNGVKRLRELILTLAVQGKLTEQRASDEPASELLKKIAVEKKKLEKEGKIKKQKPLPPVGDDEKPYALPNGWEWGRLGEIAAIERGGSPRPIQAYLTESLEGLNWIKIGDTEKGGKYITSTKEKITPEGLSKTRKVYPGDFLLTNSMSFGRPYITQIEGCIHDGWLRIAPPSMLNKEFLYFLLSSSYVYMEFARSAAGAVVLNLNSDKVRELFIPLPPLAEQQRIVERVNALMTQCDALEAMHKEQEHKRASARAAAMHALTMPQGNAAPAFGFSRNWGFLARHFEQLFTTKQDVAELRKNILQLAVMGKLTEQQASDEPASELLKKIAAEKKKLEKEGKIKKQKPLPPVGDDEKPYALPKGWDWVRLGEICSLITDGTHYTPTYIDAGIPFLSVKNLSSGMINFDNTRFISEKEHAELTQRCKPEKGDILFTKVGTTGIAVEVDTSIEFSIFVSVALLKIVNKYLLSSFVTLLLNSPLAKKYSAEGTEGVGNKNLVLRKIYNFTLPLPPLTEQQRIVERVNALMALCDTLEQNIDARTQTQTRLLDAVATIA